MDEPRHDANRINFSIHMRKLNCYRFIKFIYLFENNFLNGNGIGIGKVELIIHGLYYRK